MSVYDQVEWMERVLGVRLHRTDRNPGGATKRAGDKSPHARVIAENKPLVGPMRSPARDDENIKKWNMKSPPKYLMTPYGEVALLMDTVIDVPAMVDKAVKGLKVVEDDYTKAFLPQMKKQERALKPIAAALANPSSVEASFASAPASAVALAETAETSKNAIGTLRILLKDLHGRLRSASTELQMANRALEIVTKRASAAKLREQAEQQEALIGAALTIVGAAIESGVNVGAASPGKKVEAAYKPIYDAVISVYRLFRENKLLAQADALETQAKELEDENIRDRIGRANDDIRHANEILGECQAQAVEIDQDFDRQRRRAEREFDKLSKTRFKFKPVADAIAVVKLTPDVALKTALIGFDASKAVWDLQGSFSGSYEGVVNKQVTDAMANVMNRSRTQGTTAEKEAKMILDKLDDLRAIAHQALVKSNTR